MKNLEELLNNTDFSKDSKSKEAVKARILNTLKYKERKNHARGEMFIKKNRFRPYAVAAAVTITALIAACSVFYGEDIIKAVQLKITVGRYATFVADNQEEALAIMHDADEGVSVKITRAPFSYDAEIEQEKGIVTYFNSIDDVKPYLAFNPLMPVSLPSGFVLDRISLYNDENARPLPFGSNMYLNVHYTDAEKTQRIYMQLRLMDEETEFSATGGHDMRYISINGHDGVVDGKNVNVEIDGVMYMILAGRAEGVTQDDIVRMAESIR